MAITLNGTTGITTPDLTSAAPMDVGGSAVLTAASSLAAANLTGTVASGRMPAGSVLQVVNGFTSTMVTTSVILDWIDTGITATITPQFASSKIMVLVNICGMSKYNTSTWNRIGIQILRGTTLVGIQSLRNLWTATTMEFSLPGAMYSKLDSPASTSPLTYKVQFQVEGSSSATGVSVQRDSNSGESQIFLMEIST